MMYLKRFFGIWLILSLAITIGSCTKVNYVPVESVRTDSTYIYQLLRDSIYVQDSIYIREKGDTVYKDRIKYLYKEKFRIDTIYTEKIDTVRVPYPVERKLSKWEQTYLAIGRVSLWVIIVIIVIFFIIMGSKLYKLFK